MKVITYETLYHEDHGAYFEAQVWKKDSSIVPSLFFSHFLFFSFLFFLLVGFFGLFFLFGLLWPFFIWASLASFIFHKVRSLIPTYGGIIVSIILFSLGQCSNNDDHHTLIFLTTQQLQLDT